MNLVYVDETGDDGYPAQSSPLFVLTSLYFDSSKWQELFDQVHNFRSNIAGVYGLPVKTELHTKYFVLNKKPYIKLGLDIEQRIDVIEQFCYLIANIDVKIVSVTIDKQKISRPDYKVLERSLSYLIQRIENDLEPANDNFLMITDEGRVGNMQIISRKLRKFNPIPQRSGGYINKPITTMIEDPLPKNSQQSYFIQLADFVSYIVYMHKMIELNAGRLHNRWPQEVNDAMLRKWLQIMKPSLNLAASPADEFGIVCYPK